MSTCVSQQQNSDYLSWDRILPTAKGSLHVQVNDETNLEQLFLFKGLKYTQTFGYLWVMLNVSELGFHAAL